MPRILHRRPNSGFVKYPDDFGKRIIDGSARFRTRCDMLVGPCACGHVHQEYDGFVEELLEDFGAEIETINLPLENDRVLMPRYWKKPDRHINCDVLVGDCACGRTHKVNEYWVVALLAAHNAKILGCETDEPIIEEEPLSHGCQCPMCTSARASNAS